jgi:hypothetical protein
MLLKEKGIDIAQDIYTVEDAERALADIFGGAV